MFRIFGHYVPRSLILMGVIESLLLILSIYIAVAIRFSGEVTSPELQGFALFYKSVFFSAIFFLALIGVGLYKRDMRDSLAQMTFRVVWAFISGLFFLVFLFYIFPGLFIGRGAFLIALLAAFVLIVLNRWVFRFLSDNSKLKANVMILGTGERASNFLKLRRKSDWEGINLVGYYHLPGARDVVPAEKIVEPGESLEAIVKELKISELVIATNDGHKNFPAEEIIRCKMDGVRVTQFSNFFEQRTGKVLIDSMTPGQVLFLDGFQRSFLKTFFKRLFDLVTSLVLLVLLAPVMMVVALFIRRESNQGDPIFYHQVRVGKNAVPFVIYKFRTMVVNAEANGAQWASKDDDRITPLGKMLRKTRLDELPQLWNVLKGDMSFIGPRPERPEFVKDLEEQIPYYAMRHRVKPGITGWAQVRYPYGDTLDAAKQKLQFDLYYIKNYSTFLDFTIFLQTMQVIVWQQGAR